MNHGWCSQMVSPPRITTITPENHSSGEIRP